MKKHLSGLVIIALCSLILFTVNISCKTKSKIVADKPKDALVTDLEKFSYAFGVVVGSNFAQLGVDTVDADLFVRGAYDYIKGKNLLIEQDSINSEIQAYIDNIKKTKFQKNIDEANKFFAENKKKPGVVALPSGLQYQIIKEGNGPKPTSDDEVEVHYHGTLIDGTVFDSSVERGESIKFPVTGVIKGWVEALQLMPVGSKWKIFIPSNLAYGENPPPGGVIQPHSALIFEVELISISPKQ